MEKSCFLHNKSKLHLITNTCFEDWSRLLQNAGFTCFWDNQERTKQRFIYLVFAGMEPDIGSINNWAAWASARQESLSNEKLNAFSSSFTKYTVCSAGKPIKQRMFQINIINFRWIFIISNHTQPSLDQGLLSWKRH